MAKLEIDSTLEEVREGMVELRPYDLNFRVLEVKGPAGGNPLVEVCGPRDQMIEWLFSCREDPLMYIGLIQE